MRRLGGIVTVASVLLAVGALGCRMGQAKATGESSAQTLQRGIADVERRGEVGVGKNATPRSQWGVEGRAPSVVPWTPPRAVLGPGVLGASEALGRGDSVLALERLTESLAAVRAAALPEARDPGAGDNYATRLIAARSLRLLGRPLEALALIEPLEGTRHLDTHVPLDVFMLELARTRFDAAQATPFVDAARDQRFSDAADALYRGQKLKTNRYRKPMKVLRAMALAGVEGDSLRSRKKASFRAVRALDEIIGRYPDHADRPWWKIQRARALSRAERYKDARAQLREVVIESTGRSTGAMAWVDLVSLTDRVPNLSLAPWTHQERLRRAEAALRNRSLHTARRIADELSTDEELPRNMRSSVEALQGDIAYRAQDFSRCVEIRARRYEASPTPDRRDALSRCLERADRYDDAIELWLEVANDRKRNRHNRTAAFWTAAQIAMRGARYERASTLLDAYEKRSRGHVAQRRFMRTWIAYRRGELEVALAGFEEIASRDEERRTMARYYQGKVLLRSANPDAKRRGERALRAMARDMPYDYYGLQARSLLKRANAPVPGLSRLTPLQDEATFVSHEDVARAFEALEEVTDGEMPSVTRAASLFGLGYLEEARREFRIASDGAQNTMTRLRGSTVRKYRTEAYEVGAGWEDGWRMSTASISSDGRKRVRTAADREMMWPLFRTIAKGIQEPYRYVKFTGYDAGSHEARWHPRAYRETVEREAHAFTIDPSHLWALMYTESRFRRFVVSHAGARGAIQIMPVTERRLVHLESGFSGEVNPDDLFDIDHNVHLAGLYISELMEKFQGQGALAYASYNAGPVNVARWLRARGDVEHLELDDFIEEIPYRETYRYTRRVLEVRAAYEALYGQNSVEIDNAVDLRIGTNINF